MDATKDVRSRALLCEEIEFASPLHSAGFVKTKIKCIYQGFSENLMAELSQVSVRWMIRLVVHDAIFRKGGRLQTGSELIYVANKQTLDKNGGFCERQITQHENKQLDILWPRLN